MQHADQLPILVRRAFHDCSAPPTGPVFLRFPEDAAAAALDNLKHLTALAEWADTRAILPTRPAAGVVMKVCSASNLTARSTPRERPESARLSHCPDPAPSIGSDQSIYPAAGLAAETAGQRLTAVPS